MYRATAAGEVADKSSSLALRSKRLIFVFFVVFVGIGLLYCDKLASYTRMRVLQWRVDDALPKGSKYEDVEQWCLKNKFQAPYAQKLAPRDCKRMIAWKLVDAENGNYLGIDFYFDSKMTLLWQNAFRGGGINDDNTRSLAEQNAAAATAANGQ